MQLWSETRLLHIVTGILFKSQTLLRIHACLSTSLVEFAKVWRSLRGRPISLCKVVQIINTLETLNSIEPLEKVQRNNMQFEKGRPGIDQTLPFFSACNAACACWLKIHISSCFVSTSMFLFAATDPHQVQIQHVFYRKRHAWNSIPHRMVRAFVILVLCSTAWDLGLKFLVLLGMNDVWSICVALSFDLKTPQSTKPDGNQIAKVQAG